MASLEETYGEEDTVDEGDQIDDSDSLEESLVFEIEARSREGKKATEHPLYIQLSDDLSLGQARFNVYPDSENNTLVITPGYPISQIEMVPDTLTADVKIMNFPEPSKNVYKFPYYLFNIGYKVYIFASEHSAKRELGMIGLYDQIPIHKVTSLPYIISDACIPYIPKDKLTQCYSKFENVLKNIDENFKESLVDKYSGERKRPSTYNFNVYLANSARIKNHLANLRKIKTSKLNLELVESLITCGPPKGTTMATLVSSDIASVLVILSCYLEHVPFRGALKIWDSLRREINPEHQPLSNYTKIIGLTGYNYCSDKFNYISQLYINEVCNCECGTFLYLTINELSKTRYTLGLIVTGHILALTYDIINNHIFGIVESTDPEQPLWALDFMYEKGALDNLNHVLCSPLTTILAVFDRVFLTDKKKGRNILATVITLHFPQYMWFIDMMKNYLHGNPFDISTYRNYRGQPGINNLEDFFDILSIYMRLGFMFPEVPTLKDDKGTYDYQAITDICRSYFKGYFIDSVLDPPELVLASELPGYSFLSLYTYDKYASRPFSYYTSYDKIFDEF